MGSTGLAPWNGRQQMGRQTPRSIVCLNEMGEVSLEWIEVVEIRLRLVPAYWLYYSPKLTSYKERLEGSFSMEY